MISDFVGPKKPAPNKSAPKDKKAEKPDKPPEHILSVVEPPPLPSEPDNSKPTDSKKKRQLHLWPKDWSTKKKRLFTGGLIFLLVLVLAGAGTFGWRLTHKPKKVVVVQKAEPAPPPPTTEASKLMGVQVNIADNVNKREVVGVMIENSPDARPQSGLNQASIVYEAVAEGGITRFLALFQENQPEYLGPIRSSRPYYLDWLLPFDAAYAHVGGSPQALADIKSLGVKDIDQFYNSGAYSRVSNRYAPHNVYSSLSRLTAAAASKGYTSSTFTSFVRNEKEDATVTPKVTSIDFSISAPLYNPHYDYDAASHTYKRSEGGKPHTDEKSGQVLAPKVVIALVVPSAPAGDGTHNSYSTVGSGPMYVFQDGQLYQGTWKKDSRSAQLVFTGTDGQPLKLSPGQTWISMVNTTGSVVYK